MSQSRGKGNRFGIGQEAACRTYFNSKQADKLMIVCFLQRRLNTSYAKKLWWQRARVGGRYIECREVWGWDTLTQTPQSVIELVLLPRQPGQVEKVMGRSFVDGTVWLDSNLVYGMPRRTHRTSVHTYLATMYYELESNRYTPKRALAAPPAPPPPPVAPQEAFSDIMNREWSL